MNEALGLDKAARAAVHDLVHVRRALVDGQVGRAAVRPPDPEELRDYALMLREELDDFLDEGIPARHKLTIIYELNSAMAEVELVSGTVEETSRAAWRLPIAQWDWSLGRFAHASGRNARNGCTSSEI